MDKEKKNKIISAGVTAITMIVLMVFMICCGFTEMVPPPPAKKAILIELDANAGGGGGGISNESSGGKMSTPQHKTKSSSSEEQVAMQNAEDAPNVSTPQKTKTSTLDVNASYQPRNNNSTSNNPGPGGPGPGSPGPGTPGPGGPGPGGLSYGQGTRSITYNPIVDFLNPGDQVYVVVHVDENGNVIGDPDPYVITDATHNTTVTDRNIRNKCIDLAKKAKYAKGKNELRYFLCKYNP